MYVLRIIGDKRTSKEIAAALCVGVRNVEKYRASIRKKLGLRGPNALLIFALEHKSELGGPSFELPPFSQSRRAEE